MKTCDQPVPLIDFWRGIDNSGIKNATRSKIVGWTHVRGEDIVIVETEGLQSSPISMIDKDGKNILSEEVRDLYEQDNPVFIYFYRKSPKAIVFASQPVLTKRPLLDFIYDKRKRLVYSRSFD
jgi:hypothetical protein